MSKAFRLSAIVLCALSLFGAGGVALAAQNGASSSQPGPAKQDNGQKNDVKVTHYGDWDVRCPKSSTNKKNDCEMTQLINNPKTGKPIMRIVVGYPSQIDTAAMIFITPLGTRLAPGIELSVDGDQARHFPFQICLKQGCRADYPIKDSLMKKLKLGKNADVTIVGPRGNKIQLEASLHGFTDANDAITQ